MTAYFCRDGRRRLREFYFCFIRGGCSGFRLFSLAGWWVILRGCDLLMLISLEGNGVGFLVCRVEGEVDV